MTREVLKMALEVLNSGEDVQIGCVVWTEYDSSLVQEAITAIEATLAQPEQNLNCKSTQARLAASWGYVKAQPEQPKYRRGSRLLCIETEEYCVIHISGTDRQWVKFPDSHIGVYTNEQVVELFELLPKETDWEAVAADQAMTISMMQLEQEPVAMKTHGAWDGLDLLDDLPDGTELYTSPPKRQPLTDAKIWDIASDYFDDDAEFDVVIAYSRAIEAAHGIGEKT